jgi:GNAT superfamily N-acetyltransferase
VNGVRLRPLVNPSKPGLESLILSRYAYETADTVTEDAEEAVYAELRTCNQLQNPVFWSRREEPENAPRALNVLAFDADGKVVGGIFAETQFSWLKISIMAVREALRGQGIGAELVRHAEEEAARRGCKYAFVDTMSYQAPGFYQRLGYQVAGQVEDWDSHGHAKFYLTRQLQPGAEG